MHALHELVQSSIKRSLNCCIHFVASISRSRSLFLFGASKVFYFSKKVNFWTKVVFAFTNKTVYNQFSFNFGFIQNAPATHLRLYLGGEILALVAACVVTATVSLTFAHVVARAWRLCNSRALNDIFTHMKLFNYSRLPTQCASDG